MATQCTHYGHLAARFRELCTKFLDAEIAAEVADPATFNPDLDRIAAFRLLFHAEIETFLEEKARERLAQLEIEIGRGVWHRSNPQLLSIYLIVRNLWPESDDIVDGDLRNHFVKVIGSARSRVKENNGIKAQAFTFLSIMAGKSLDEIDATLSSMLNSYGKDRGEVAHNSAARSRTLSAPSVEKANGSTMIVALAAYYEVYE